MAGISTPIQAISNSRIQSSPIRRKAGPIAPGKNFIAQNKLRVLKKLDNQSDVSSNFLPEIKEKRNQRPKNRFEDRLYPGNQSTEKKKRDPSEDSGGPKWNNGRIGT